MVRPPSALLILRSLCSSQNPRDTSHHTDEARQLHVVCRAFARAYDPSVIAVHIENIARALLVATVYDREINVRRAASSPWFS